MLAEAILSLCNTVGEMIASHRNKTNQTSESSSKSFFVFSKFPQIYCLPEVVGMAWLVGDILNKSLALVLFIYIE